MNNTTIVGIAGLPRSGKDSLAELFLELGYFGVSLGDIVRDVARQRHAGKPDPISVQNMTETSNFLRTTKGPDFALKEAFSRYEASLAKGDQYKGLAVWSVRAPVEVDYILAHGGRLIWVEASDEVRHARMIRHRREGEAEVTVEQMHAQEALQEKPQPGLPPEVQMNTTYVKQKATEVFENNGNDLEAFYAAAHKLIG
jgi:dephospho-CoA kinase